MKGASASGKAGKPCQFPADGTERHGRRNLAASALPSDFNQP
jgi:hypothetical protein